MRLFARYSSCLPAISFCLFLAGVSPAQDFLHESKNDRNNRMGWWREARFGLFLHWGLYAVPAGHWGDRNDYGEWIRNSARIPLDEYSRFVSQFNPVKFDAKSWVRMAKEAGMRYIVITSKHHDGFCLFDSKFTDFNVMSTPFHRDVLAELADACRKEDVKLCFYYSIMDWHHPDYLPHREWETTRPAADAEFARYVQYMKNQLKELLTRYGDIGVLWFDGEWEPTWNHLLGNDLYNYVRRLQPAIIVNNRVGAGRSGMEGFNEEGEFAGDFGTPEQEIPATGIPDADWETCMTMNDHWGYNAADTNFKSSRDLIRMLVDIASKGGNFLLNIGPTAEGVFPPASIARLHDIGAWMKISGESVYGTTSSPFSRTPWGRCTRKLMPDGSVRLYFHLFDRPSGSVFSCNGLGSSPRNVWLLQKPGTALSWKHIHDTITVVLPPSPVDSVDAVLVMDFPQSPLVFRPPVISAPSPLFLEELPVTISGTSAGEIHYTLDGSLPDGSSPLYQGPVRLTQTALVTARAFYHGSPVSDTVVRSFTRAAPEPAAGNDDLLPGVSYSYYEGSWDSLPAFDSLTPAARGVVRVVDLSMKHRKEYFGVRYEGCLVVPQDGVYLAAIRSDDGSRLFIGGKLVADNDGLHGSATAAGYAALGKGAHPFRIEYFNKTGDADMDFQLAPAGRNPSSVVKEFLFHFR